MNKKIFIGLALVFCAVVIFIIFSPIIMTDKIELEQEPSIRHEIPAIAPDEGPFKETIAVDERAERMKQQYSRLEDTRQDLKKRLASFKTRIWNIDLTVEQATEINKDLGGIYLALKNPPLLGSFRDEQEIDKALRKVDAAHRNFDMIDELLNEVIND